MVFTLGCDPEVFVKKDGAPISAYGLIPGNKTAPYKTERGAVQVDGMALEFNTNPVDYNDFDGFNENIVRTKAALKTFLTERGDGKYNIVEIPVMEFDPAYLASQPDEAKELGCDPDYDAYTLKPNPRPDGDRPFRTGAGHVHVGWGADIPVDNEEHIEICANFVRTLDATVGLFMTFIDRDPRRRELYGKAGAFRPKPYGVEYRTPSNVWIRNKDRRFLMHNLINRAISHQQSGNSFESLSCGLTSSQVQKCINEGKVSLAATVLVEKLGRAGSTVREAWRRVQEEMTKEEEEARAKK
jgi:Phage phiEco32-like COOH.NH2 ligase-type 2